LLTLIGWKVCTHFIGHVLEERLWRANLKVTFGFAATRFRSVRGTENEGGRSKQRNRYEDGLFVHGLTHKGAPIGKPSFFSNVFGSLFGA
jgi:hypothetical protein